MSDQTPLAERWFILLMHCAVWLVRLARRTLSRRDYAEYEAWLDAYIDMIVST